MRKGKDLFEDLDNEWLNLEEEYKEKKVKLRGKYYDRFKLIIETAYGTTYPLVKRKDANMVGILKIDPRDSWSYFYCIGFHRLKKHATDKFDCYERAEEIYVFGNTLEEYVKCCLDRFELIEERK